MPGFAGAEVEDQGDGHDQRGPQCPEGEAALIDEEAGDGRADDLRAEFDLVDRYGTLTQKLEGVQDALELVLDVARDRRMWLLELTIGLLIVFEVLLELLRRV